MSSALIQGVVQQAGKIILGKERQLRLALACLLARGLRAPFSVVGRKTPAIRVRPVPRPESQLNGFLMRVEWGCPDRGAERERRGGADRRDMIAGIDACLAAGELVRLQSMVKAVHVA